MLNDYLDLPYAHGNPLANGILKAVPEDFIVEEIPLVEPCGEGEHQFLYIEKKDYTTEQVAKDLAEICQVSVRDVSYAGLKDKHALTRQWFSVHCPGRYFSDIGNKKGDNWSILSHARHSKKLKTGALKGNKFTLVLRSIDNPSVVEEKLINIQRVGVPNYFTAQRFGHCGHNLLQAKRMLLEGKKVKNRFLAGLYLSAIRSYLFNHQVAARIRQNTWRQVLQGDVLQLAGTRSLFTATEDLELLQNRLEKRDVIPTAILWGRGSQLALGEVLSMQTSLLEEYTDFLNAIEQRKVERAYRAIILHAADLHWHWLDQHTLQMNFSLPAGSYATAIVRELIMEMPYERFS